MGIRSWCEMWKMFPSFCTRRWAGFGDNPVTNTSSPAGIISWYVVLSILSWGNIIFLFWKIVYPLLGGSGGGRVWNKSNIIWVSINLDSYLIQTIQSYSL